MKFVSNILYKILQIGHLLFAIVLLHGLHEYDNGVVDEMSNPGFYWTISFMSVFLVLGYINYAKSTNQKALAVITLFILFQWFLVIPIFYKYDEKIISEDISTMISGSSAYSIYVLINSVILMIYSRWKEQKGVM